MSRTVNAAAATRLQDNSGGFSWTTDPSGLNASSVKTLLSLPKSAQVSGVCKCLVTISPHSCSSLDQLRLLCPFFIWGLSWALAEWKCFIFCLVKPALVIGVEAAKCFVLALVSGWNKSPCEADCHRPCWVHSATLTPCIPCFKTQQCCSSGLA